MKNVKTAKRAAGTNLSFVLRHSLGIRISSLVISKESAKKLKN